MDSQDKSEQFLSLQMQRVKEMTSSHDLEQAASELGVLTHHMLTTRNLSKKTCEESLELANEVLTTARREEKGAKQALIETCELLGFPPLSMSAGLLSETYDALGLIHMQEDNLPAALLAFNKAISLGAVTSAETKDRGSPYFHICNTYIRLQHWKQAVRYGSQAVAFAEEDMKKSFAETAACEAAKSRLKALYSQLAECEDALHRTDRAHFWLKKSICGLGLQGIDEEVSKRLYSNPDSGSQNHAGLTPSISLDSVDQWISKPGLNKSESLVLNLTMSNCWSHDSRDSSSRSNSREHIRPVQHSEEVVVHERLSQRTGTSVSTTESVKAQTMRSQDINSSSGQRSEGSQVSRRHGVSLRIQSRTTPTDSPAKNVIILHQSWVELASKQLAQITVMEGPMDSWVVTVQTTGTEQLSIERKIPKGHPWRNYDPKTLVSMLELGPENNLTLSETSSLVPGSGVLELHKAFQKFDGLLYEISLSVDDKMKEVAITAKTKGKVIRKAILNDIDLRLLKDVEKYAREVLAPQVVVTGDKIRLDSSRLHKPVPQSPQKLQEHIEPSLPEKVDFPPHGETVFRQEITIPSEFPASVTVQKPAEAFLMWVVRATLKDSSTQMSLKLSDREVTAITGAVDPIESGKILASLLIIENGCELALADRRPVAGVWIKVMQAEEETGRKKEYVRIEAKREGKLPLYQSLEEHAVAIIQRCVRTWKARRLLRLLKSRPNPTLYRSVARVHGILCVVSLSMTASGFLRAKAFDVVSKVTKTVESRPIGFDLRSKTGCEDAISRLFPHVPGKRLILSRKQRIKGKNYQVSVYSRNGQVEIRASELS